ncbi:hypothetical protein BV511_07295 [Methylorubrum extorquens]|nr:hypothetical protein BV511_07295 [Methylorubrum extorquens]
MGRLLREVPFDEISRRLLAEFVAIRNGIGATDATIRQRRAVLGSVLTIAIRSERADTSPIIAFNKRI